MLLVVGCLVSLSHRRFLMLLLVLMIRNRYEFDSAEAINAEESKNQYLPMGVTLIRGKETVPHPTGLVV